MRDKLTDILLYLLRKVNKWKDTSLSIRLHDIADQYDKYPTGEWDVTANTRDSNKRVGIRLDQELVLKTSRVRACRLDS